MKVVRLLQDMQAELTKEAEDDEAVYKKLSCWCKQNDKDKSAAIELGEAKMEDLKTALGEYAAKIEELRVGLAETKSKLKADQEAINTATAMRTQEGAAFHNNEKELLDAVQACKEALVVLNKHNPSLAQIRGVARTLEALKTTQLAKDTLGRDKVAVLKAFLQQAEEGSSMSRLRIPGFKSYEPQSGQIFGILKQMQEEFEADLTFAQETEKKAVEDFKALRAAKQAELEAGKKQLTQLEQDDADFREKNVQAYEELNDTREQVETDKTFLMNLQKRCSETDEEYQARTASRAEELKAVSETIAFLNNDEAFDVFDKTVNSASPAALFLQTATKSVAEPSTVALRRRAAQALRRAGTPALALLAENVQIDAFTKVKAAIDKMIAELTKQTAEEVEHRDWCKDEMQTNKRETDENTYKKESLENEIADTKKMIESLTKEIKIKTDGVASMEEEMARASAIREAESADFAQTVADQRITQAILKKAIDRMNAVYSEYVLMQQRQQDEQPGAPHIQTSGNHTDPGNGPARFNEYSQNKKGGAAVAMMETVLKDAKNMEDEAMRSEQDAQSMYENFMKDSNASIKKYQRAIVNMSEDKAKAEQALTMAETDLKDTMHKLEDLNAVLGDLKLSCDFILKNFGARQDARTTELEALNEAKAILSGMKEPR